MNNAPKLILLILTLLFCINEPADGQDNSFIVISCIGNVTHTSVNANSESKVIAGNRMEANGKLILEKDAIIKLIFNERPTSFTGPAEIDLAQIYSDVAHQSMSFTGRFWKFIVDGLKNADSDEDLEKYHQQYLSVKGGIKGYTVGNDDLSIQLPIGNIVSKNSFVISWKSKLKSKKFTVIISNTKDRKILWQKKIKGKSTSITAADIRMVKGEEYYLTVIDQNDNKAETLINFMDLDQELINRKLESIIGFQDADETDQKWMTATVLEMEGYMMDAHQIYQELTRTHPNDKYIGKLYRLFLVRNNQQ